MTGKVLSPSDIHDSDLEQLDGDGVVAAETKTDVTSPLALPQGQGTSYFREIKVQHKGTL